MSFQSLQGFKAIIIQGPTACGKSSLAIDVAKACNGIIINADSLQWYDGLSILTAQPTADDKERVPHCLYGVLPVEQLGSAALWVEQVLIHLQACALNKRIAVIVGGTGLYIKALLEGLSPIPAIEPSIRESVRALAGQMSLPQFYTYVLKNDPYLKHSNPPVDQQRLARALEVFMQTGQSIRTFQGQSTPPVVFDSLLMVHMMPCKIDLQKRIAYRLQQMVEGGVLTEIEEFDKLSYPSDCMLRRALGLGPLTQYLHQELTLKEALELACIQTRQYAKRQMTWLKGQGQLSVRRQNSALLVNPALADMVRWID